MESEELLKNIMFRCPFCGHMQAATDIKDHKVGNDRTVKEVFETMDTDQRTVMYYLIGKAIEALKKRRVIPMESDAQFAQGLLWERRF